MIDKAIVDDAFFWERIGYRNAWVTIMQLPLLFMLASKANFLALLTGTSYERLNWLHRWVARTIFVTATVHGWHFWAQWVRADFVEFQMKMMPMTKYGLGAWGVLLWINVSSLAPLRRLAYEIFVLQHIASAVILIWLVYVHVPKDARYFVWWCVGALCLDIFIRLCLLVWQNVRWVGANKNTKEKPTIGHCAELAPVGNRSTLITIKNTHASWRPGQHFYIWMPWIGPLDVHPYTVACIPNKSRANNRGNDIQMVVRSHGGFSKRLLEYTSRLNSGKRARAFLVGPFGALSRWETFETLVLLSASTGASYTLPILDSIIQAKEKICTKRVDFVLVARNAGDVQFYESRLLDALDSAKESDLELKVQIHITRRESNVESVMPEKESRASVMHSSIRPRADTNASVNTIEESESDELTHGNVARQNEKLQYYNCRPDLEEVIRGPVEAAGGELSVVVCGGLSLTTAVRNIVSQLSDERAVHKGTGAQGIHLHVEEYTL